MLAQALVVAAVLASSAGVGIDPAAVAVTAAAGEDTAIGELVVRNPGDGPTSYQMFAQPGGTGHEPDVDWFHFEPADFELEAGGTQAVQVSVSLPSGTPGGDYSALLTAAIVTDSTDGGVAQIAGAVATTARLSIRSTSSGASSWTWIGIAIAALVAVGLVVLLLTRHAGFATRAPIAQTRVAVRSGGEPDVPRGAISVIPEADDRDLAVTAGTDD